MKDMYRVDRIRNGDERQEVREASRLFLDGL